MDCIWIIITFKGVVRYYSLATATSLRLQAALYLSLSPASLNIVLSVMGNKPLRL